jgi:hypothetical protein
MNTTTDKPRPQRASSTAAKTTRQQAATAKPHTPSTTPPPVQRQPMQDGVDALPKPPAHMLPPVSEDPIPEPVGRDADAPAARVPFGAHQPKLQLPEREGFKRRWFHDTPGRIQRALRGGWSHVKTDGPTPENERRVVGVGEHGGGLVAYALEIPVELYEQDMAAQQSLIDEFDELMLRGVAGDKAPGDDGRYQPERANKPITEMKVHKRAT